MEFHEPIYLVLIIIIPILIIWYNKLGKNQEGTIQISSTLYTSSAIQKSGIRKNNLLIFSYLLIIFLIIIALARPRIVTNLKETSVSVVDILLVLDISSSMLADDFTPNRLEAVKNTAINFIEKRKEDRIGILVFAGESFIQCPLTIDKTVLKSLIKEIRVVSKEYDGTAIGMAIANGTNRFRNSDVESKIMILLSDGSNNSGEIDPITAAELAQQYDIKIYTIGAGTDKSYTRIPGRGYIVNEIDEKTLREISRVTGGKYFRATNIKALELIYDEISELERSDIKIKKYTQYKELYGFLLIPAFIFAMGIEIIRRSIFKMRD